jgi:hypothetical protein
MDSTELKTSEELVIFNVDTEFHEKRLISLYYVDVYS